MGRQLEGRHSRIERIIERETKRHVLPSVLIAAGRERAASLAETLGTRANITALTTPEALSKALRVGAQGGFQLVIVDAALATSDGYHLDALEALPSSTDLIVLNPDDLPVHTDARGRLRARLLNGPLSTQTWMKLVTFFLI